MTLMYFFLLYLLLSLVSPFSIQAKEKGEQGAFGIIEHKVFFNEQDGSSTFSIRNTDKTKSWLVQSWIESYQEKQVNQFITIPPIFRVDEDTIFSVKIIKRQDLPTDRESIFWVVAHAIPPKDKHNNSLNLAFRFKVPLFFRPQTLKGQYFEPGKLIWRHMQNGDLQVTNPTPFVVTINDIKINQASTIRKPFDGIIMPHITVSLPVTAKQGDQVDFYTINDFGAKVHSHASVL